MIKTKRVYDGTSQGDGYRVLADRFYPRGLTKHQANYRVWTKTLAPSAGLIKWFHADPAKRWAAFKTRYGRELRSPDNKEAIRTLIERLRKKKITTLLFGSKDPKRNNAIVLASFLRRRL